MQWEVKWLLACAARLYKIVIITTEKPNRDKKYQRKRNGTKKYTSSEPSE